MNEEFIGKTNGVWEVLEVTVPSTNSSTRRVRCKCTNCGFEKEVCYRTFSHGASHSCLKIPSDLTGMKFGHLTALYRDETKPKGHGKKTYWVCECDCEEHNRISVARTSLIEGRTTTCHSEYHTHALRGERVSIVGNTYANLRVDRATDERYGNQDIVYECTCLLCGKSGIKVSRSNLIGLHKKDCGCSSKSLGETLICKVLDENNYVYEEQVSFPELHKLRFDFKIYSKENPKEFVLMEYDGIQHFSAESQFYTEEGIARDRLKDAFCLGKGIKLYRIPYTDYLSINIDTIFDDKYLVKE